MICKEAKIFERDSRPFQNFKLWHIRPFRIPNFGAFFLLVCETLVLLREGYICARSNCARRFAKEHPCMSKFQFAQLALYHLCTSIDRTFPTVHVEIKTCTDGTLPTVHVHRCDTPNCAHEGEFWRGSRRELQRKCPTFAVILPTLKQVRSASTSTMEFEHFVYAMKLGYFRVFWSTEADFQGLLFFFKNPNFEWRCWQPSTPLQKI